MAVESIKTVLEAESGQFHREFSKAQSTIKNYHQSVMKIAGVLGGSALFAGVVGKLHALRSSIDKINDGAARLELPVEDFQRLQAVADLSGASIETLAKALNKSKLTAVEASQGSKALGKDFATLGINAKEFLDLNPTERILAISKGFNAASDQGAAFAAVFSIMGKGAGDLIPLLREGEAGIEAISRRLQVLGGADVAAIARMNDEIDLLSANLGTKMKGAFLSLRPQIESFVKSLSDAADGLSTFLDPAGGVGKQGGAFGGAAMLRDIDQLDARIDQIKAKLKGGGAGIWEGILMTFELKKSIEAVETLRTRYAALDQESKIYAEQLAEVERLRKSGLGEDDLRGVVQQMQDGNAERLKSIEAEKQLATAATATAGEIEKQALAAGDLAKNLETIQQKVAGRILALQSPEKKQEVARAGLADVLGREKVGSAGELRQKIGTSTNDGDRARMLKSLDEALDRMAEIKAASAEITSGTADRFQAWQDSIRKAAEAAKEATGAGDRLVDQAAAAGSQSAARKEFAAEMEALKQELAGRKELADSIRAEVEFRKEAVGQAERLGITEDQALKQLRQRADYQKLINENRGDDAPDGGPQPSGRNRSRIRRQPNGAFDMNSGNNLNNWKWRLDQDASKLQSRSFGTNSVTAGVRNSILEKRGAQRAASAPRRDDGGAGSLKKLEATVEGIFERFKQIGVV